MGEIPHLFLLLKKIKKYVIIFAAGRIPVYARGKCSDLNQGLNFTGFFIIFFQANY